MPEKRQGTGIECKKSTIGVENLTNENKNGNNKNIASCRKRTHEKDCSFEVIRFLKGENVGLLCNDFMGKWSRIGGWYIIEILN